MFVCCWHVTGRVRGQWTLWSLAVQTRRDSGNKVRNITPDWSFDQLSAPGTAESTVGGGSEEQWVGQAFSIAPTAPQPCLGTISIQLGLQRGHGQARPIHKHKLSLYKWMCCCFYSHVIRLDYNWKALNRWVLFLRPHLSKSNMKKESAKWYHLILGLRLNYRQCWRYINWPWDKTINCWNGCTTKLQMNNFENKRQLKCSF